MYALSLQLSYALALLFLLAMVFFYLPYLLVGFLILLGVLAIGGIIGWFVLKRKYGHLFKMMDPEALMKEMNRQQSHGQHSQHSQGGAQRIQADGFYRDDDPMRHSSQEGKVIEVKAEEIQ